MCIKYVIVEGQVTEMTTKKKKKAKGKGGTLGDIEGKWNFVAAVPGDEQPGTLHIKKDGDSYAIDVETEEEPGELNEATNIVVDGTTITFDLSVAEDGYTMEFTISIDFTDDDNFEGTVEVAEFGSFPFTGDKRSGPEK